ncbi:META domain-containing protein [Agromyces sp. SYSU K20354]|uniref:META domain-containing protein n=1 Tax=Agromyces cavernae TaxID=2898659 RepID=UPI001E39DAF0|nr:META domain-containing protein [Agromyces cavernae]MCD2443666.1 META domain-containing protein [Agromyces cavernae]
MAGIRKISIAGGAVFALLVLAGCAGVQGSAGGGSVDAAGTWGDTSDSTAPSLELADDGSLSGTDGCNTLNGSWSVDEADHVQFEDVATTLMACEGVDTWLSGLSEATVSGDTMTVLGQDGAEIGTLERSGGGDAPSLY